MRSAKPCAHLRLMGAVLATLSLFGACTEGKSYILVTMKLKPQASPILAFASARVVVSAANQSDTLVYPARGGPTNELTAARDVSFSVSFSDDLRGDASISVILLGLNGAPVGSGTAALLISPGRVAYATVEIDPNAKPMDTDAGVPDGMQQADGSADAQPFFACTPHSAAGCGPNQTCGVSCMVTGEPQAVCMAAGTKQPGELCTGVGDCAPGSQCFEDKCGGNPVRVCRRYCSNDNDCPTAGRCFTEIECSMPARATGVRICSQPCDPRNDAKLGCAEGLRCFIYPGEVPDCDCVSAQRVGGDGATCVDSGGCQPGLLCVTMSGSPVCRPICRLDAPTCEAGRTCQMLTNPNYNVFGACVP